MQERAGNLSPSERTFSTLVGLGLCLVGTQGRSAGLRLLASVAGLALLTRAAAGHCAVKSALQGRTTLAQGVRDQWCHLSRRSSALQDGLPGSPLHERRSEAIDESVNESFPASDPPASRLPDEPPSNADAKWAAAGNPNRTL